MYSIYFFGWQTAGVFIEWHAIGWPPFTLHHYWQIQKLWSSDKKPGALISIVLFIYRTRLHITRKSATCSNFCCLVSAAPCRPMNTFSHTWQIFGSMCDQSSWLNCRLFTSVVKIGNQSCHLKNAFSIWPIIPKYRDILYIIQYTG